MLVVDDTIENLRLLSDLLGEHGYEVRAVTNGRQALQAAEHDPPDLILLDITMPEMDGYEVCRRLRAGRASRDVPVIFLTALTDTADKVLAFDAGGVDYVTKPFQFEEVLARVKTHVALRRAQSALAESYARLRDLEQLRDDLVHMVVHDMRSPLTALLIRLRILRTAPGPRSAATPGEPASRARSGPIAQPDGQRPARREPARRGPDAGRARGLGSDPDGQRRARGAGGAWTLRGRSRSRARRPSR